MKRKSLICIILVILLVSTVVLTACGDDDEEKGTLVTFWANCNDVELAVFADIVKQFNKNHEGEIYVKLVNKTGSSYSDNLGMTLQGSKAPDVFYVGDSGYKEYAELGYLYDITDFVNASDTYNVEEMWSDVAVRYKYDTKTGLTNTPDSRYYGVPKDIGPTVLYYNESHFKGAGITILSVDEKGLEAFNNGAPDDRGNTKSSLGLDGYTVKEQGYFEVNGRRYFNNQIPMSWKETKECAIIGLIKNQRIVLEEELDDAYREYGFISKKAKFSSKYYKAEHRCNILEAKLEVVEQMEAYIMEMMKLPMAS